MNRTWKPRETIPCKYCGTGTRSLGTGMCNGCWEVDHRLDEFAQTRAGRKRLRQAIRRNWPIRVDLDHTRLVVETRFFRLEVWGRPWNHWAWHWWHPTGVMPTRYTRLCVTIPGITFEVRGWEHWGKKPAAD